VLPTVRRLVRAGGQVVALVKPQFEAGRNAVPRGGVVRDPAVHRDVLLACGASARKAGFGPVDVIRSPLAGTDGNREFLALLGDSPGISDEAWAERVAALLEASA
jgi:23S rRNA (cytidine1920-2'-O)/16S rRNA (cytidine1409-2'-O)-methyltransferase